MPMARAVVARLFLAATLAVGVLPALGTAPVAAASCVRISGGFMDAPGNDNYAAKLNGEYIRIKNYCSTTKSLGRWKLHDYKKLHTYTFAASFKLRPGKTVTVYSGRGTNTASKRYWGRTYGAVWNNTPPERAYLRTGAGKLMSSWSPY